MPLYEYHCEECGHVTEFLERADKRGQHACEKCSSRKMTKLLSTFAVSQGKPAASARSSCPTGTCPTGTSRGFS